MRSEFKISLPSHVTQLIISERESSVNEDGEVEEEKRGKIGTQWDILRLEISF